MMRSLLALCALLPLAACATTPQVHAPLANIHYSALGHDPFWMVSIGDDLIVLTLGEPGGSADGPLADHGWPRTLPRTEGDRRIWQSGEGTNVITIEARPGPCEGSGGTLYEDRVSVRLSGRELSGCGGRLLREGRG